MWILIVLGALLGVLGAEEGAEEGAPGTARRLQALHCPPCEQVHCSSRRALKLQCKGGVTTCVCGCCPVCARVEGETCGGAWDYLGKCDKGLVCVHQDSGNPDSEPKGTCQTVLAPAEAETCQPDCSREYCQAHPTNICSARWGALRTGPCPGPCQHTSCSSCLLLQPPACPQSCAGSDSDCLHRYGGCVRAHLDAPPGPVCHGHLQRTSDGHFLCLVPPCPNPNQPK